VTKSPYTGRLCRIVQAEEKGVHVLLICDDGTSLLVDAKQKLDKWFLKDAIKAVTAGQSAVIYDGDRVVGGGIVAS
jgi:tRNA U34 2-thiouridine synthase MnmA/TrmU